LLFFANILIDTKGRQAVIIPFGEMDIIFVRVTHKWNKTMFNRRECLHMETIIDIVREEGAHLFFC
jgi:hypothetical protein